MPPSFLLHFTSISPRRGSSNLTLYLFVEFQSQHQKRDISHNAQTSKHHHDVTTSTKSLPAQPVVANLAEELPVALHASEGADGEYAGAVDGEEGSWVWCVRKPVMMMAR
jgi:hypothetical protein